MSRAAAVDAVLIVLTGVGWGLLAPATKALFAADHAAFDPTTVTIARAVWTLPLWLVAAATAWRIERPRIAGRTWLAIVAAGLAFGPGITWLFSFAAAYTSVAHISFLVGVSPVSNALAAALVFRLPIDVRTRIALALGVLGVALLALTKSGAGTTLLGDAIMLLWLAGFAVYAVLLRIAGKRVSTALLMSLVMIVAMGSLAVISVPLHAFDGAFHVADSPHVGAWFFGEIVLGSTLVAQTAYGAVVRRRGVALATIGAEYVALTVGIAASIASHEGWTWATVVAGVLLCGSLAALFVPLPAARRAATST